MAWITVSDLRGLVHTDLSDSELQSVINTANLTFGTFVDISYYSPHLLSAALYFTGARLYEYLKSNGEMAALIKMGDAQVQNTIDKTIITYDELSVQAARKHAAIRGVTPRVRKTLSPQRTGW